MGTQHPALWKERGLELAEGANPRRSHQGSGRRYVLCCHRRGGVWQGEDEAIGRYWERSVSSIIFAKEGTRRKQRPAAVALWSSAAELQEFRGNMYTPALHRGNFPSGRNGSSHLSAWMGVPPRPKRSCCRKAAMSLCKAYQLSQGNPIEDTKELFESLRHQVESPGSALGVLGVGTTGYAKDILAMCCTPMWHWWKPCPYPIGATLLSRSPLHRRCWRTGHQNHCAA